MYCMFTSRKMKVIVFINEYCKYIINFNNCMKVSKRFSDAHNEGYHVLASYITDNSFVQFVQYLHECKYCTSNLIPRSERFGIKCGYCK
jgi:hypothetical protein